jgi:hypothetical protein
MRWNKESLMQYYQPWRDVEALGVKVFIGEFGCYNKTPDDVAHRWFTDLLDIFKAHRWGFSLWEFEGPFGIVNHGRPGSVYQEINGYKVDRRLLDLLINAR